jgi:hypothetical protein
MRTWSGQTPHNTNVVVRIAAANDGEKVHGRVILDLGTDRRDSEIDATGQVHFNEIPDVLLSHPVDVTVVADGWKPVTYRLPSVPDNRVILVQLGRQISALSGTVLHESGRPVKSARVSLDGIPSATTDADGHFKANLDRAPGSTVRVAIEVGGIVSFDDFMTLPGPWTFTINGSPIHK